MTKITMVKKRLANGQACAKCEQAEAMLKTRNLWHLVNRVVWADESDAEAEGNQLAQRYGVDLAPFFIVEQGETPTVYRSALAFAKQLQREHAQPPPSGSARAYQAPKDGLVGASPQEVVQHALTAFGERCAIAFSGAEDIALIDMAAKSGLSYSVFCLDTGRLHPETYRFIDKVRKHYGVEVNIVSPDPAPLETLVQKKGLFSFYDDGHQECCSIRKVAPLRRVLKQYAAWMTGQRRDQSPTRAELDVAAWDVSHAEKPGQLYKFNPLAEWTLEQIWDYIRRHDVPYNELHDRGYVSIGCEPCTRAIRPGEHERAGRWWWEEATQRECGLHVVKAK